MKTEDKMRWMSFSLALAATAMALLAVAACNTEPARDECEDVTCSDHGTCVSDEDGPRCECDDGYAEVGLNCEATPDGDGDADSDGDGDGDGDADVPCTWETLRADAIENGEPVLAGITLEESTPIWEIWNDLEAYEGQFVQIEGYVVGICDAAGCWARLRDPRDNRQLVLKVPDGLIDFRTIITTESYGIGEGYFTEEGEHEPQVSLTGAVFTDMTCD